MNNIQKFAAKFENNKENEYGYVITFAADSNPIEGELTVTWKNFKDGNIYPRLEVNGDSWYALSLCKELLDDVGTQSKNGKISIHDFETILSKNSYRNVSHIDENYEKLYNQLKKLEAENEKFYTKLKKIEAENEKIMVKIKSNNEQIDSFKEHIENMKKTV